MDLSVPHISRDEIESILGGIKPQNLVWYRRAFVHKSVQKEVKNIKNPLEYLNNSNETLEFLGDSVLNLIVTHFLFEKFPQKDEGSLTRIKTKIVCRKGCAKFARHLDFGRYILTNESININKETDKILEDTFEAFMAAIFLDLGFKFAKAFLEKLIVGLIDFEKIMIDTNYKDILLRYSHSEGYRLPVYEEVMKQGPSHGYQFTMSVTLYNKNTEQSIIAYGKECSKKYAEQEAAKNLLNLIDKNILSKFVNRDK